MPRKVIVIGAGAAGMLAAFRSARSGAEVQLFERNDRVGRKLGITGKGRCNVTNDCPDANEFLSNVVRNPRFLYSSLAEFSSGDTMALFESLGVPLKVERGRRVFPVSDRAADIVNALRGACERAGVAIVHSRVSAVVTEDRGGVPAASGVRAGSGVFGADSVILATGGKSYSATGSTGDGYAIARKLGHTIIPPAPALVGIVSPDPACARMQGLSLRNVRLDLIRGKKTVYSEQGELLFTHYGVSGPLALSASCYIATEDPTEFFLEIDLKPALDERTLDARVLRDFDEAGARIFGNSLGRLLPRLLIPEIVAKCGVDPGKPVSRVTAAERAALVKTLKSFVIPVGSLRPIEEAIITAGGVSVKEISPKTMESKLVTGLYFAGEVIDVHALTGGYNLQIAFSTADKAGRCASGA